MEEPFARRGKLILPSLSGIWPALSQRLKEAGYDLKEDMPLEGFDRRYVSEPLGHRIELMQPTAERTR